MMDTMHNYLLRFLAKLLWLSLGISVGLANGQDLLPIAKTLRERQSALRYCTVVWDASIEVTEYPIENPEALLEAFEQWDKQRPDVQIPPESKQELLKQMRRTLHFRYQTKIHIRKADSSILLETGEGIASSDGGHTLIYPLSVYYGDDYAAVMPTSEDPDEPHMYIFSHSTPAPLHSTSRLLFISPIDWVFLLNFSIFGICGCDKADAWRIIKRSDKEIIIECVLKDAGRCYSHGRIWRVGLSKQRGWAPEWAEEFDPYLPYPVLKIQVLEWRKVGKHWLPQRWIREKRIGKKNRISSFEKRILTLSQLDESEVRDNPPSFPVNTEVLDYRLVGNDIPYGAVSEAPKDRVVVYKWSGRVPTLAELEQIARRQQAEHQGITFVQVLRTLFVWGIPVILILVGLLWWKRSRG